MIRIRLHVIASKNAHISAARDGSSSQCIPGIPDARIIPPEQEITSSVETRINKEPKFVPSSFPESKDPGGMLFQHRGDQNIDVHRI
jgi:hypothetical protein